jgi:hypothetical protein
VRPRLPQPATIAAKREPIISFARSLFELYCSAPDLSVEAPGVGLDPFLPAADAAWFAYLDDAEEFYASGPAFHGSTSTTCELERCYGVS